MKLQVTLTIETNGLDVDEYCIDNYIKSQLEEDGMEVIECEASEVYE